ncbi:MAG: serine/threonine-protein kinase [Planctomycetota bacterium]
MTPEQFKRARSIFERLCDAPRDERERVLDSECEDDPELRRAIEAWLDDDARPHPLDDGLDMPAAAAALSATPNEPSSEPASSDHGSDHGARFVPGTMLGGRYRVVSLLGRGGMGEVYRADDLKLGQPVALKFLPRDLERNEALRARLLKEVRTARSVTHMNVCRVYDIAEVDGQHCVSMEYVDGEDLASLLRRIGRLPEDKAVEVARGIAAGLQAAHEQGILHRDLKPANVMIDGHGRVKITDFGLAELEASVRSSDIRSGTPQYMAPEQLAGEAVTVRSEVYAYGLVLYELLTGTPAFDRPSPGASPRPDAGRTPPPPSPSSRVAGLDRSIEEAILRCLEHDPLERPETVAEVAAALPSRDALQAAVEAGETPSPELVAAARDRRMLPKPALVALLCVVIAGVVGMFAMADSIWFLPRAQPPKSPARLAADAENLLARLREHDFVGPDRSRDAAWGIAPERSTLRRRRTDPAFAAFEASDAHRPPAFTFWYRQSPSSMTVRPRGAQFGRVTSSNPDAYQRGMVNVELDPKGRLLVLTAVPQRYGRPAGAGPDWSDAGFMRDPLLCMLFKEAGLDIESFEPAAPVMRPRGFADQRAAWTATLDADLPVRVEAAALDDHVVAFEVRTAWRPPRPRPAAPPGAQPRPRTSFAPALVLVVGRTVFLAFGGLLAWRNFRRQRGDLRGALTLWAVLMITGLVFWFVALSRFPFGIDRLPGAFEAALASTLFWSTSSCLLYYALEPYVRRRVPERLIAWSRLLSGRWRDPLVGRDVLIGLAAGLGSVAAMATVDLVARSMFTLPERLDVGRWTLLTGSLGQSIGAIPGRLGESLWSTFISLIVLLLLKIVTRRLWIAAVLLCIIQTRLFAPGGPDFSALVVSGDPDLPLWGLVRFGVPMAVFLFVLVRYGVLAGVMACAALHLLQHPGASTLTAWYGAPGTAALLVLAALGFVAFRIALGGRPLVSDTVLET